MVDSSHVSFFSNERTKPPDTPPKKNRVALATDKGSSMLHFKKDSLTVSKFCVIKMTAARIRTKRKNDLINLILFYFLNLVLEISVPDGKVKSP